MNEHLCKVGKKEMVAYNLKKEIQNKITQLITNSFINITKTFFHVQLYNFDFLLCCFGRKVKIIIAVTSS